jgi:hypothetical protein|tara:strand:+ start:50 stop:388 length:339 start_codon:yes stop_codon:yes gene_type:complete
MEIIAYITISILTLLGVTSLPTRRLVMMNPGWANFFPIISAIIIWTILDAVYLSIFISPIPIALFFICWLIKLIEDNLIKKADWQINIGMAEAWVLFIWGIFAAFGDYRPWY